MPLPNTISLTRLIDEKKDWQKNNVFRMSKKHTIIEAQILWRKPGDART